MLFFHKKLRVMRLVLFSHGNRSIEVRNDFFGTKASAIIIRGHSAYLVLTKQIEISQ